MRGVVVASGDSLTVVKSSKIIFSPTIDLRVTKARHRATSHAVMLVLTFTNGLCCGLRLQQIWVLLITLSPRCGTGKIKFAKAAATGRARNAAAAASHIWVGGEGHSCQCADMVVE